MVMHISCFYINFILVIMACKFLWACVNLSDRGYDFSLQFGGFVYLFWCSKCNWVTYTVCLGSTSVNVIQNYGGK